MEGAAGRPLWANRRRRRRHRCGHRRQRQRQRGRRRRGGVAGAEQPLGSFHHAHELLHAPRVLQQLLRVAQQLAQLRGLLRAAGKLKQQAACRRGGGGF